MRRTGIIALFGTKKAGARIGVALRVASIAATTAIQAVVQEIDEVTDGVRSGSMEPGSPPGSEREPLGRTGSADPPARSSWGISTRKALALGADQPFCPPLRPWCGGG